MNRFLGKITTCKYDNNSVLSYFPRIRNAIFFKFFLTAGLTFNIHPFQYLVAGKFRNPFDQQRLHADPNMGLDPTRNPMEHGTHFNLRALQGVKTTLDHHQTLVAASRIFQADGIVVGLQNPFTVVSECFAHFTTINADRIVLCYR